LSVHYRRVKLSHRSLSFIFGTLSILVIAVPVFWVEGGCNWLQTKVFPPKRPRFMPVNSVWIDALSLPISWHRGSWFGCGVSSSGTTNYCRLVDAEGPLVFGSEYLPCSSRSPIDERNIHLLPPPHGASMWLFGEGNEGVIGFLADGDILLPVSATDKCGQVKARLLPARR
jgi:hypothetical protein